MRQHNSRPVDGRPPSASQSSDGGAGPSAWDPYMRLDVQPHEASHGTPVSSSPSSSSLSQALNISPSMMRKPEPSPHRRVASSLDDAGILSTTAQGKARDRSSWASLASSNTGSGTAQPASQWSSSSTLDYAISGQPRRDEQQPLQQQQSLHTAYMGLHPPAEELNSFLATSTDWMHQTTQQSQNWSPQHPHLSHSSRSLQNLTLSDQDLSFLMPSGAAEAWSLRESNMDLDDSLTELSLSPTTLSHSQSFPHPVSPVQMLHSSQPTSSSSARTGMPGHQQSRRRAGTVAGGAPLPRPLSIREANSHPGFEHSQDVRYLSSERGDPGSSMSLRDLGAIYDPQNNTWVVPAEVMKGLTPSLSSELAGMQLQSSQAYEGQGSSRQFGSLDDRGQRIVDADDEEQEHLADVSMSYGNTRTGSRHPKHLSGSFEEASTRDNSGLMTSSSFDSSGLEDSLLSLQGDQPTRWIHGRDTPLSSPSASAYLQLHGTPDTTSPSNASIARFDTSDKASQGQQMHGQLRSGGNSVGEFAQMNSHQGASRPEDWPQTWPRSQALAHAQFAATSMQPSQSSGSAPSELLRAESTSPTTVMPSAMSSSQARQQQRLNNRRSADWNRSPGPEGHSLRRPTSVTYARSTSRTSTEGLPPLAAAAKERRLSQTFSGRRVVSPSVSFSSSHQLGDVARSSDSLHSVNSAALHHGASERSLQVPMAPSGSSKSSSKRRNGNSRNATAPYDEVSAALSTLRQFLNQKEANEATGSGSGRLGPTHARSASALGISSSGTSREPQGDSGSHRGLRHVRGRLPPRGSVHLSPSEASQIVADAGVDRASPTDSRNTNESLDALSDLAERVRQMREQAVRQNERPIRE